MDSIARLPNASPAIHRVFDQFTLWGLYVRGGLFVVALLAALWAVVKLGPAPMPETEIGDVYISSSPSTTGPVA